MYVIGTAGHVDHGKSTLIKALTGINPDRLAEEQERQMTIDLGFAWYILPSGEEIGIVDVPGHRDFIENMLAGVGGVDAILFVVAADEGIMPQSREHLNIVKLLGIEKGIIVLTKIDLVQDADWLELVEADVRDLVKNSFLENAPILRVSAIKGDGLDVLSLAIDKLLEQTTKKAIGSVPRLPIDRVFSLKGFGTVVTGTLIGASFSVGDQVVILPSGIQSRIRGLQTHKRKQEIASPGNRTAVNLIGVEVKDIVRGDVLCLPNSIKPSHMLDISVDLLPDFPDSLKHDDEVKVFTGTTQKIARVRVLGGNEIAPGKTGFAQLMLVGEVVVQEGDRLILRRPSPPATIGGGIVISASPAKRYKRFVPEILERLEVHASGSIAERVFMAVADLRISDIAGIAGKSMLPESELLPIIHDLTKSGSLVVLDDAERKWYLASDEWEKTRQTAINLVKDFHLSNPLKRGVESTLVQNGLRFEKRIAKSVIRALISDKILESDLQFIKLPSFSITLTKDQQKKVDALISLFASTGTQPPSVKEAVDQGGEDLFQYLVESGTFTLISPTVVFLARTLEEIIQKTNEMLSEKQKITVADFRDYFNTSRKYAVSLLEYMDGQKITIRDGDFRMRPTG
jgi:selenocysteine-specific elongation factor